MRLLCVLSILVASAAVCSRSASAQPPTYLNVGDVATAGKIELVVMRRNGASSTIVPAASSVTTLLWDPTQPDSFILGTGGPSTNGGFLQRGTFIASNQMVSTLVAPSGSFSAPAQLSWDQTGKTVIVVDFLGQVRRVDVTNGQVTNVTTGAQPWGSRLSCGMLDPLSGDIYVGTAGGDIWRIPQGAGLPSKVQSGLGSLQKILIDSDVSPHWLHFASDKTFGRFDLRTMGTPQMYFGVLGTPAFGGIRTAAVDEQGNFVFGTRSQVFRLPNLPTIPPGGQAPSVLGTYSFSSPSGIVEDLAVIGETTKPFRLIARSVPILGARLELQNAPTSIGVGYVFISRSTNLPIGAGPFFGIMPDNLTLTVILIKPVPGNPLAFANAAPPPVTIPQFGMSNFANETWDLVSVIFDRQNRLVAQSNIVRVTWR